MNPTLQNQLAGPNRPTTPASSRPTPATFDRLTAILPPSRSSNDPTSGRTRPTFGSLSALPASRTPQLAGRNWHILRCHSNHNQIVKDRIPGLFGPLRQIDGGQISLQTLKEICPLSISRPRPATSHGQENLDYNRLPASCQRAFGFFFDPPLSLSHLAGSKCIISVNPGPASQRKSRISSISVWD